MMKRKIFKKLMTIEKKCVLCLMLIGFTAMNSGFTGQEEEVPIEEPTAIEVETEETSANEPTAIAVGENGRLTAEVDNELTLAFAEVVEKSLGQDLTQAGDAPFDNITTIEDLPAIEEQPPENVIETAQGYVSYAQVMDMEATAYLPTDGSGEGITAMGIPATYGIVAVDPDVIPLGSRVYIPGYGEALAADTGGAIYGNRIDLCMEDYYQAMDFGRRNVTVFVLK